MLSSLLPSPDVPLVPTADRQCFQRVSGRFWQHIAWTSAKLSWCRCTECLWKLNCNYSALPCWCKLAQHWCKSRALSSTQDTEARRHEFWGGCGALGPELDPSDLWGEGSLSSGTGDGRFSPGAGCPRRRIPATYPDPTSTRAALDEAELLSSDAFSDTLCPGPLCSPTLGIPFSIPSTLQAFSSCSLHPGAQDRMEGRGGLKGR